MKALSAARGIIAEELRKSRLHAVKILLFGSRARGDSGDRSDWDFFVTVEEELTFSQRREVAGRMRWHLAQAGMASDVIIRSSAAVGKARDDTGCLAYYVLKEGIEL